MSCIKPGSMWKQRKRLKYLAQRLLCFGILSCVLVPFSGHAATEESKKAETPEEILAKLEAAERQKDFDASLEGIYPLSVEEIVKARQKSEIMEQVIQPVPARMRTESRTLHVTPGAAPQVVKLTAGYSSTIVFQDVTGAPWPVLSMILGAPSAFSATQPRTERAVVAPEGQKTEQTATNVTSNIINIVPLTQRASSNLVVNLEDCPYPVIIHLLTESSIKGKRSADALVVFQLDKGGPKAIEPQLGPSLSESITPELLGFVHGVPPANAILLKIDPPVPGVRVWKHNGRIFLRTVHSLVWPAWHGSAGGEDQRVYILPPTQSAVLSVDGSQQKIVIRGGR